MKRLSVLLLVALAFVCFSAPAIAEPNPKILTGPYGPHKYWTDTDRKVPVVRYCDIGEPYDGYLAFAWIRYTFDEQGNYTGTKVEIWKNRCLMNRLHYTKAQRQRVTLHELYHAMGWMHFEGSPDPSAPNYNAAYYP
jgi:hypothetical protein